MDLRALRGRWRPLTARVAYRTALRAIAFGGSASISEITDQLGGLPGQRVDATFVEQLFSNLVTFRWVDRAAGVFWFAGAPSPVLASVAWRSRPAV